MMNLHNIVRGAIQSNLPDEEFTLYRSLGQVNNDEGIMTASYSQGETIKGNFQSDSDAALHFSNMSAQNTIIRKLYVYATEDRETRPWSLYRPLSRTGDYIQDKRGDYWLVLAVTEDYSNVGWECLRVQLQQVRPELNIIEPKENEDNGQN
ncbi:MAG: hypothetical protein II453_08740 [Alphaproteobacteria bacterium]|nr:hypothetical protein [Alphaproteobacteria bacterium]